MLAVLLVAVSLSVSNFAASIGIGISGIDARTRWRVGVVFGVFEAGMPIVGLLLGRGLAGTLGGRRARILRSRPAWSSCQPGPPLCGRKDTQ